MASEVLESDSAASLQAWVREAERSRPARFRIHDEPAYVLAVHPWSESSLVAELFTRSCGRVPVVVKGAKRGYSRFRGLSSPLRRL